MLFRSESFVRVIPSLVMPLEIVYAILSSPIVICYFLIRIELRRELSPEMKKPPGSRLRIRKADCMEAQCGLSLLIGCRILEPNLPEVEVRELREDTPMPTG